MGLAAENQRRYTRPGRRFRQMDITCDELPPAGLVLCREVLVHFPDDDIELALANFRRSGAHWLLATTFMARDTNDPIELGSWRTLNLEAPRSHFPRRCGRFPTSRSASGSTSSTSARALGPRLIPERGPAAASGCA